jgi:hypothetical protein
VGPLGEGAGRRDASSLTESDLLADLRAQYPRLTEGNHRITSPPTGAYNCVAWVNRDTSHWFEPDFTWPDDLYVAEGEPDLDAYVELFRRWGFEECESGDLEAGHLKIAIYATGEYFQHVAKQLPSGAWSSKNGRLHDLRHEGLDALEGSGVLMNARPSVFMRRRDDGDLMPLEERGFLLPSDLPQP